MVTAAFTGAKGARWRALADLAVVDPVGVHRTDPGGLTCSVPTSCVRSSSRRSSASRALARPMPGQPDAVLLDRDGTINVKAPEGEYITRSAQLELLPGAAEAIRQLNRAGVPVAVVTNQRGIALGKMSERDLESVHSRLAELLHEQGAAVDEIFYCPHENGACACRKPGTLLLRRAQRAFRLPTLHNTVMIGDSASDVLAGQRAGAPTVLLTGAATTRQPHGPEVAASLLEAVRALLS